MPPPRMVLVIYLTGFFSGGLQVQELPLDKAPTSFDDQYNSCMDLMDDMVGELQRTEFANKTYANLWKNATAQWNKKRPEGLKPEYGIAVAAYTESKSSLYRDLNSAVREAGKSKNFYLKNFKFKSFHYLLTRALQTLQPNPKRNCYITYRGVKGVKFITQTSEKVRFGFFASSSQYENIAMKFGDDTFFTIKTCHGAYIKKFSVSPHQEEVLIPPYELFKVKDFVKTNSGKIRINLTSDGSFSNYNCVYAKGLSHLHADVRMPFLFWGFLLMAGALGAPGFL